VRRVDLRDEQRNVRVHTVIFRIADHRIAGAGKNFFGLARDGGVQRGENKIAIERRLQAFYHQVACGFRDRSIKVPAHRFGVALARGSF
jgi:hypothetical protein